MERCSCCRKYEVEYRTNRFGLCRYCNGILEKERFPTKDLYEKDVKEYHKNDETTLIDWDMLRNVIIYRNDVWQRKKQEIDEIYKKIEELA